MGQKYGQLSLEQRCTIARYSEAGKTIRQIAAAMDRAPSTIMRELKRNRGTQIGEEADCFVSPLCRPRFSKGWDKAGRRPKSLVG